MPEILQPFEVTFMPDGSVHLKAELDAGAEGIEEAVKNEVQSKYDEHERHVLAAREKVRREREEAEISGQLTPEADLFLTARLKPRISEAHDFQPVVRTPIVQGLFFRNSLTWVAGRSGTFKSFVTADLAFRHGQEDMDFHGMRMTSGRSLLVVAEGSASYADRKTAWEKEHGREVKNVSIYPAPLQLGDTLKEMPALLAYLKEEEDAGRPFTLILFDTQAMCTVGIDENTSEMNLVINVLHRVREVSGACVMVVHHFGKDKRAGMRGSSMIHAAADTVCVLKRDDDSMDVKLSTSQADEGKQKDAETRADFLTLELKKHPVGEDFFGDTVFSLVPRAVDAPPPAVPDDTPQAPSEAPSITEKQMPYLRALSFFRHHGAGQTELAKRMNEEEGSKITYPALVRSTMIGLEDKGLVEIVQGKWKVTPLGASVVMQEIVNRQKTEEAWSSRPQRRLPDRSQDDVFPDVSETPEKTSEAD